jgi:hypothetical protein
VPIDYRYHIGSFVAIFVALLLGILIGVGLAPNPEELNRVVKDLKADYRAAREAKEVELRSLQEANREYDELARMTVAATVHGRLAGQRVAIILDHQFVRDTLPDNLRALLKQAGATITSTTIITSDFVTLPPEVRTHVSERLSLYPPPNVHFRTVIAEAIAKDLAEGRPDLILDLHASGLLQSATGSKYNQQPDAVLLVGGYGSSQEAAPERIDLPMIEKLTSLGVRVVGCEAREAPISCIPLYKTKGIPTVDDADTLAGRLSVVLALAGADGNFGVKDTRDYFLPKIPLSSGP